ncbi:unnamed protein product [Gadus morhua 'NCC']
MEMVEMVEVVEVVEVREVVEVVEVVEVWSCRGRGGSGGPGGAGGAGDGAVSTEAARDRPQDNRQEDEGHVSESLRASPQNEAVLEAVRWNVSLLTGGGTDREGGFRNQPERGETGEMGETGGGNESVVVHAHNVTHKSNIRTIVLDGMLGY